MVLRDASLADLVVAWSVVWTIALSVVAMATAPNDLRSIAKALGLAGSVAIVVGTWFAATMWVVIRLAS